jgi:hypothetical protein
MAVTILVLSSIALIVLAFIMVMLSDPNPNQGYLFCSIYFKSNSVANTINFAISLLLIIFLVVYLICYFNIGKVYYKNINSLEESVLELHSLETVKQHQASRNSRYLESNTLRNNSISAHGYNPKFQVIKIKLLLRFSLMIIVPFIEIFPIGTFLILNHYLEIHGNELVENICYWIAEFSPLTKSLMILFLHRETWESFYNLIARK